VRTFPKGKQVHCTQCGRTMSRRDREQQDGTRCYYCCAGKARPPAGDLPAYEVEQRLQAMVEEELKMPWERKRRR